MPQGEKLTTAIRQRAAAKTNALIAKRKRKRRKDVRKLAGAGRTPAEIATILGVSHRTILRDLVVVQC